MHWKRTQETEFMYTREACRGCVVSHDPPFQRSAITPVPAPEPTAMQPKPAQETELNPPSNPEPWPGGFSDVNAVPFHEYASMNPTWLPTTMHEVRLLHEILEKGWAVGVSA